MEVLRIQRLLKNYKAADEGRYRLSTRDEAALDRDMAVGEQRIVAITRVVEQLRADFPTLAEPLTRMLQPPSA